MKHYLTLALTVLLAVVSTIQFASAQNYDSVQPIENIPYAYTDNPRQMLDLLLLSERGDKSLPVVVFIHGGGWRNGDKLRGRNRIEPFVATERRISMAFSDPRLQGRHSLDSRQRQ